MQPEEFKQFHERAKAAAAVAEPQEANGGGDAKAAAAKEEAQREQRIADVYDMFVQAKVMRR